MEILLISLLAGYTVAIPAMGPASALVLRDLVRGDYPEGLSFAGGSILAEGMVCLAAIWGVEVLLYTLPSFRAALEIAGVALLLGVGIFLFATGTSDAEGTEGATERTLPGWSGLHGRAAAGFAVTALNPTLLATWTSLVGSLLATTGVELAPWQRWTAPLALMLGEFAWFGTLVVLMRRFEWIRQTRIVDRTIRALGVALVLAGSWGAYRLLATGG